MPVLFRTIYACGLRCSEARLLRPDDVDIDAGVLQIRDAKGGSADRLVLFSRLWRCSVVRGSGLPRWTHHALTPRVVAGAQIIRRSFPGRAGLPLTLGETVEKNLFASGSRRRPCISPRPQWRLMRCGPRVHDLRHTFAVNNLRFWFAQRVLRSPPWELTDLMVTAYSVVSQ